MRRDLVWEIVEEFLQKIGSAIDAVDFSRISGVNKLRVRNASIQHEISRLIFHQQRTIEMRKRCSCREKPLKIARGGGKGRTGGKNVPSQGIARWWLKDCRALTTSTKWCAFLPLLPYDKNARKICISLAHTKMVQLIKKTIKNFYMYLAEKVKKF